MTDFIIPLDVIRHERELEYRKVVDATVVAREALISYNRHVVEPMRIPDLTAMLQVSPRQFPQIDSDVRELSVLIGVPAPRAYIYEGPQAEFGVNAEGIDQPWLEISAFSITQLTRDQLRFRIARELAHIRNDYIVYEVLLRGLLQATGYVNRIPGIGTVMNLVGPERLEQALRLVLYRYTRCAQHTSDRMAYCAVGGLRTAAHTIMTGCLRSAELANKVSISEWYGQAKTLDSFTGFIAARTKLDELMPYPQYRVRDLVGFAARPDIMDIRKRVAASNANLTEMNQ